MVTPASGQDEPLRRLFLAIQAELQAGLQANRVGFTHPGAKGSATESDWLKVLQRYLPMRYRVDRAFVIDSNGKCSEQLDAVVYDRQFSPTLFARQGEQYIPAESVYGVLEVKQELNLEHIKYAGAKVASVRRLYRSSAPIPHAGGIYEPREPQPILAGIVALQSGWHPPFGAPLKGALCGLTEEERLDIGCALQDGTFEAAYQDQSCELSVSDSQTALIHFVFATLRRLQAMATVPAIDYASYERALGSLRRV